MKSARSPAVDAASGGRRLQPARQARTNPSRSSALQRTSSGRGSAGAAPASDQSIDIFPGITHFADAITALPKELVRHFTLLKEVDAKGSGPEQHLQELVRACLDCPLPQPIPHADAGSASHPGANSAATAHSTAMSAQGSSASTNLSSKTVDPTPIATAEAYQAAVHGQGNTPRRQLFLGTAARIKDMLMSLDEKNHVICTANEVLQRQLARVEDVWPHLEAEFSDEAKWGSTTHWAYPENNKLGKVAQNDRTRRDGQSAGAAQQAAEEAAARSESRKQAVQARRNQRNLQVPAADADDAEAARPKGEGTKRTQGSKSRKTAEASGAVGLGITPGAATPNPPSKRRRVEKPVNGGTPTERAMSTVFGNTSKAKSTTSPRGTPAAEGQKKRKALPSGPTQTKKSRNTAAASPSATSSPVIGTLSEPKTSARASPVPAPSSTPRPGSARSRPNATQPVAAEASSNANGTSNANSKAKAPSAAPSSKANGTVSTPELTPLSNMLRQALLESESTTQQPEPIPQESTATAAAASEEVDTKEVKNTAASGGGKNVTPKPEALEKKAEPPRPAPIPVAAPAPPSAPAASTPVAPTPPTVTTKSGRASKPSTPAMATFQEATATARSRSSRAAAESSTTKRSHKKSASQSAGSGATAAPAAAGPGGAGAGAGGTGGTSRVRAGVEEEDEGDIDADELTYCYCNSVSYGAMVACDSDECAREWFHLECVGLKVPPKPNVKWFCEDCKKRMKIGEKKSGGR